MDGLTARFCISLFICVIVFLAIASAVYILASDPTKGARKVWKRPIFKWW